MPDIRMEVLIAAPVETVFAALTEQDGLAGWWTPNVVATPQEGSIARFGFGPTYVKQMHIKRLDPLRSVQWECVAGADEWVGTSILFRLEAGNDQMLRQAHPEARGQIEQAGDLAAGTVLSFSQEGWAAYTPMFAECSYTWGRFLRSLKLLCETGTGHPSPREHRQ
jgi:uncharacterized protein YndB with AHSA1/START domain